MNDRIFFTIVALVGLVISGIGYWAEGSAKKGSLDHTIAWGGSRVKWIGIVVAIVFALLAYFTPRVQLTYAPAQFQPAQVQNLDGQTVYARLNFQDQECDSRENPSCQEEIERASDALSILIVFALILAGIGVGLLCANYANWTRSDD